jgi:lysosomal Pro-X carboxypeptidase
MVLKTLLCGLAIISTTWSPVDALGTRRTKFVEQKFHKNSRESFHKTLLEKEGAMVMKTFNTKVDNFNISNEDTFPMRYIEDLSFYNSSKPGPILFYAGNEGAIEGFYDNSGFLSKTLAEKFGGFVVFAEHRFYGESFPEGGMSIENLKYLSVEQVMMDYVKLLGYLRTIYPELATQPAFLFGGSYGGMLASWIRMKYPTHFQGAIASSAPILWFKGVTDQGAYNEVVAKVI